MHELIASFNYGITEIHPGCTNLFNLGVQFIEKEFDIIIYYEVTHNNDEAKVELRILDVSKQSWYSKPEIKEIIIYKLITHLKISLYSYHVTA